MSFLRVLFCCLGFMLVPVQAALSQQTASNDDIKASLGSCGVIQQTLDARTRLDPGRGVPSNTDYNAAGQVCDRLNKAISSSDPQQIQSEAASLRPILARLGMAPATPQEQLAALEKKTLGLSGKELFYNLPNLAKRAFNASEIVKAEAYSQQLLQMAPEYPKDWNYGNAIFYGNLVLGRVALRRNNVVEAGQYLLAAGATPGSPQLNSFGPNMVLAKELLEKGESDVVLQYFELCKNFWRMDHGKLDEWSAIVKGGGIPDLSSNLNY
jgi:hypothetical protein